MLDKNRYSLTLLSAAIALTLNANPTLAQSSESVIEEVIVTANKREESIQDVAMTIQAFSDEDLLDFGARDIGKLHHVIPGLSVLGDFSTIQQVLGARGVAGTTGHEPTVGMYFDGTSVLTPGFGFAPNADIYDINRVEVLKGPQGTLYGAGAMGGAIRVLTNDADPTAGLSGSVQLSKSKYSGGDDSDSADIALNLPVAEDVFALRLIYSKREVGGFIDDVSGILGEDINPTELETKRAKFTFTPNDQLTIKGVWWDSEVDEEFGTNVNTADPTAPLRNGDNGQVTRYGYDFDFFNISISYDLGFATVENVYSETDVLATIDFASGTGIFAQIPRVGTTKTNELRITSNDDNAIKWIAGIYYQDATRDDIFQVQLPGFFFGLPEPAQFPDSYEDFDSESISYFGEISYTAGDWEFLLGLRYFEDDRSFVTRIDQIENPNPFGAGLVSEQVFGPIILPPGNDIDETFDTFTPRINVKYTISDNAMVYTNIGKGFRSGFLNFTTTLLNAQNVGLNRESQRVVEPDELWSYEIGAKGNSADGAFTYQVAAYYIDWEDTALQVVPSGVVGIDTNGLIGNMADTEILGFEFGISYAPFDGLVLSANGNLMDTEATLKPPFTGLSGVYDSTVFAGDGKSEMLGVPEETFTLAADYTMPAFSDLELNVNLNYSYRSSVLDGTGTLNNTVFGFPLETDGYGIANLSISLADPETWQATLYVNNVADDIEVSSYNFGANPGITRPREIGLRLKYEFN